jgi:hypothetical protein
MGPGPEAFQISFGFIDLLYIAFMLFILFIYFCPNIISFLLLALGLIFHIS